MTLWKITDRGPSKIQETRFKQEKLLEEHLENWIVADPSLLGESLLVIGRQVFIPDTKDRLDILAVDTKGMTVIIELKRGQIKDPVDIQALRYASYISKWKFENFENVAKNFYGKVGDPDFNFNGMFETFCEEAGVDEIPDLNEDQRIIVVGSSVRDKLGSVALWLRDHNVDITLIEVQAFKEGDNLFIQPSTIIPVPVSKFMEVGRIRSEGIPWSLDGMTWHLEKRCSPRTREMFQTLDQIIQDEFDVGEPRWSQKNYVAYPVNNYNWLCVHTKPKFLVLDFQVKAGTFDSDGLSSQLKIEKFDIDDSLSEKLGMPSSVFVKNRNVKSDRVRIRAKEDFNFHSEEFIRFLKEAYKSASH